MFRNTANYFKVSLWFAITFISLNSCSEKCEDTLFEINSIGLTPRTIDLSTGQDTPWSNEAALQSTKLALRLDMPKSTLNPGSLDGNCIPKFRNKNKVKTIKMVSNQAFAFVSPGEDLLEACVFTGDGFNFIDKPDFVKSFMNESNFPSYFILFNFRPNVEATHSLRLIATFEDGTTKESDFVEVLIKP